MIVLGIHNVEKIQVKRTTFKSFVVLEFVLTQEDGTKTKVQAFSNSEGVELEWEPEEVIETFQKD
jgi:hypothetical protein